MELLKHELYKIFKRKSVLIALAIFISLSLLSFFVEIYSSNGFLNTNEAYSIYKSYEGDVTKDKIERAEKEISRLNSIKNRNAREESEYNLYSRIRMSDGLLNNYEHKLIEVETNIRVTHGYDKKQNEMLYKIMKKAGEPKIFYTSGWDYIIGAAYSMGTFIIVAMILLGLASVFTGEYSSGMDAVILSSKNGKRGIITAKIGASIIYVISIDIFFQAINFIFNVLIFGIKGWNAPMQSLMDFVNSPYAFTVLQFYIIEILVHLAGCLAFGMLVLLISSMTKNSFIPFASGALIFLLPTIINSSIPIKTPLSETVILFSLTWMMQVQKLFQLYRVYNIFGQPLLYPVYLFILVIALSIICIFNTYRNFRTHEETF